ncbi:hypothetical protein EXIGLDRAFT_780879 [Exidia glandulosa HHB12029]|uniref:Uncharacterized protein n=1 Tax=Exidia glandulosa HHB12029 TaxID=1314781 RepID=A0A165Z948_EXIGL|nr:hypothetical protein EXIGLDRAFT_780879 [Exidia glandulosa HHB12029]
MRSCCCYASPTRLSSRFNPIRVLLVEIQLAPTSFLQAHDCQKHKLQQRLRRLRHPCALSAFFFSTVFPSRTRYGPLSHTSVVLRQLHRRLVAQFGVLVKIQRNIRIVASLDDT